jgi:hypothetical protein
MLSMHPILSLGTLSRPMGAMIGLYKVRSPQKHPRYPMWATTLFFGICNVDPHNSQDFPRFQQPKRAAEEVGDRESKRASPVRVGTPRAEATQGRQDRGPNREGAIVDSPWYAPIMHCT